MTPDIRWRFSRSTGCRRAYSHRCPDPKCTPQKVNPAMSHYPLARNDRCKPAALG